MQLVCWFVYLSGFYPLLRAFRANRHTSLAHAVVWAALAWLGWAGVMAVAATWPEMVPAARYVGLCLIGCTGVAVLGARRPGVGAWNFVVAGLLVVQLLPLAEGLLISGVLHLSPVRLVFLGGILAVGVLNYVPTRHAAAAGFLAAGCALECWLLLTDRRGTGDDWSWIADLLLGLVPWAALVAERRRPAISGPDRLWLDFRDRFGLVWGQRLREQFNRSMVHAGRSCELGWGGLRPQAKPFQPDADAQLVLGLLMKRFVSVVNAPEQAD